MTITRDDFLRLAKARIDSARDRADPSLVIAVEYLISAIQGEPEKRPTPEEMCPTCGYPPGIRMQLSTGRWCGNAFHPEHAVKAKGAAVPGKVWCYKPLSEIAPNYAYQSCTQLRVLISDVVDVLRAARERGVFIDLPPWRSLVDHVSAFTGQEWDSQT